MFGEKPGKVGSTGWLQMVDGLEKEKEIRIGCKMWSIGGNGCLRWLLTNVSPIVPYVPLVPISISRIFANSQLRLGLNPCEPLRSCPTLPFHAPVPFHDPSVFSVFTQPDLLVKCNVNPPCGSNNPHPLPTPGVGKRCPLFA